MAQLKPGDILVADYEAGPNGAGYLFLMGPDGTRTVLSDFGDPAQGPLGLSPFGVAIIDVDSILVIDNQGLSGNGALFLVSASGSRTIVSDFSDPTQGPLGTDPVGVTVAAGSIWVTDKDAGTDQKGALFKVDMATGDRTLVSDFGDGSQGPTGETPTGVARAVGGAILVIDPDAGTDAPNDGKVGGNGALFSVNPATGVRAIISDFGNGAQGPTGVNPGGVALGAGGVVLVADTEAGAGGNGALFKLDPLTGVRTVLSTFGELTQGATGVDPFFVALSATGLILVSDSQGGTDIPMDGHPLGNGALFTVDSVNGKRTLQSDFGDPAKGPTGVNPVGVGIVPLTRSGDALVISPFSGTNGGGELLSVSLSSGARTVVSDFGNALQGPMGFDPVDLAIEATGDILVVDEDAFGAGVLFRVNPLDGARAILSAFNNAAQGPTGAQPHGLALEPGGDVLVVTNNGGTGNKGALFRVDPTTGVRTLLSDFGDPAQGPLGEVPESVKLGPKGHAFVIDYNARISSGPANGALFKVKLETGVRTVVSNFNDTVQGPTGIDPIDLEVETSGAVLVTDRAANPASSNSGVLFRVNASTGFRTILSDFNNPAQGPTGPDPISVALDPSGVILVGDFSAGTGGVGALFTVDAATGERTILSDFGDPAQGPTGARPLGVAVFEVSDYLTPACDGDFDEDGDIDGLDLAEYAKFPAGIGLDALAANFGDESCP
jgi:hypothetical protein